MRYVFRWADIFVTYAYIFFAKEFCFAKFCFVCEGGTNKDKVPVHGNDLMLQDVRMD